MQSLVKLLFFLAFFCVTSLAQASTCGCKDKDNCPPCKLRPCCTNMGGVDYCDSSAGRVVCKNGYVSSCYCTRHAVMDLQKIQLCCTWHGGVLTTDEIGLVICNDGSVSEVCTLGTNLQAFSAW